MKDLNHVDLIGRLTRDAEAPQGSGPARFAIAVNRPKKQGDGYIDEASFIDLEYWHKSALPYLVKGKQIAVSGEIRQDRWEKDGQKHSRIVVVANDIQLLGGREDSASRGEPQQGPAAAASSGGDEFTDDIPF